MKRFVTLLLALSLMAGAFAGCGGNGDSSTASTVSTSSVATSSTAETSSTSESEEPEIVNGTYVSGLPIAAEPITLNLVVERHPLDQTKSYDEKEVVQGLTEKTGITVEWTEITSAAASEKIPLMLASGDLPDVFVQRQISDTTLVANEESFLPIEDLVETYAPNVMATYNSMSSDWTKVAYSQSGHMYGFLVAFESQKADTGNGIQIMNKKWLDQVGMDVPTTTDELYEVLKAFKGIDFNGNGVDDEIPFASCDSMWCASIDDSMGWWGIGQGSGSYYQVRDGEVQGFLNMDEYRQFLEYFHKLYAEGLINPEFASDSVDAFSSKIKEGKVGTYYSWTALEYLSGEEAQNWVTVPTLTAIEGVEPVANGFENKPTMGKNAWIITTACEHPEAAIRLWDYFATDTETKLTYLYGEKGVLWDEYEDGSGYYNIIPDNTTESFTYEHMKYTYGMGVAPPMFTIDETPVNDPEISPDAALRDSMIDAVSANFVPMEEQMLNKTVSAETSERLAFIFTDLDTHIKEFRSQAIINGVTDESWNEYVQRLSDLNYDEYIQLYQGVFDGTLE